MIGVQFIYNIQFRLEKLKHYFQNKYHSVVRYFITNESLSRKFLIYYVVSRLSA